MIIFIVLVIVAIVITLNFLRFSKYKDKLEPNSRIIVDLINNLTNKEIPKQ